MKEKKSFSEEVKEESLKVVNELLEDNEELDFFITGFNVDAIYARAAMVGAGLWTYGATNFAGYPTSDTVEYTSFYFTNKSVIVLNCNKYLKMVNNCKIKYDEIRVTNLYKKDRILEIVRLEEKSDSIAVEFGKEVLEKYNEKISSRLIITEENSKYSSGAKKAYNVALGGSVAYGAIVGTRTAGAIMVDKWANK